MRNSFLCRFFSLITALSIFIGLPLNAFAEDIDPAAAGAMNGTAGDCFWRIEENTLAVYGSGSTGNYTDYNAPWSYAAFNNVFVGNGVTSIGDGAFRECRSLKSAAISRTVASIGDYAFVNCVNLYSVTIHDSVTVIGDKAFGYIYDSATGQYRKMNSFVIYGCPGSEAESYANDNDIRFVDVTASGTTGLCTWRLQGKVLTISGKASMGDYSDYSPPWHDAGITEVVIEDGVTTIGFAAFSVCTDLRCVTIGNAVVSVGNFAFYTCPNLTSVSVPRSVTSIGAAAFGFSYTLERSEKIDGFTIYGFPGSAAQNYADGNGFVFENVTAGGTTGDCTWRVDGAKLTISGNGRMADYSSTDVPLWRDAEITEVIIEDGVTSVGDWAFTFMESIERVTIGYSVETIGDCAFCFCKNIENIIIPDSVTKIGDNAFDSCESLAGLCLGDSVESIGEEAFFSCSSLVRLRIPDSVVSIGNYAFEFCTSLKSLRFGNSVTEVGVYAFYSCSSLTSVTLPSSLDRIWFNAFGYNESTENQNSGKIAGFTVCGYPGSAAQTYADDNGFRFVSIYNESVILRGDTDGDRFVTILDVTAIQRHLLLMTVQSFLATAADTDKDGEITLLDATEIQRHLAGLPTQEPDIGEPLL